MPEKITLICTSHNPNMNLFQKMLDSTYSKEGQLFDERIIHWNEKLIRKSDSQGERIIREGNNYSIPDAYNSLIDKHVNTEWICCFCDDDYFYSEELSKMIDEIHKGCYVGIAHFKYKISGYRPPQDLRSWILGKTYDLCEKQPITEQLLRKHNRLPAGSFFRKDVWKAIGGFKGDKFHDHNFWLRAAQFGFTFKYYDHLVYNHVRRQNSAWIRQHENKT